MTTLRTREASPCAGHPAHGPACQPRIHASVVLRSRAWGEGAGTELGGVPAPKHRKNISLPDRQAFSLGGRNLTRREKSTAKTFLQYCSTSLLAPLPASPRSRGVPLGTTGGRTSHQRGEREMHCLLSVALPPLCTWGWCGPEASCTQHRPHPAIRTLVRISSD